MVCPPEPSSTGNAARDEQTLRLLAAAGDTDSAAERDRLREQVAALNRGLALGVARAYHGRGVESDDIDQVALLGLWKAILGYAPTAGATFAAYAVPTVTGEVKRYFRDHGWLVRPSRSVQEQSVAVNHAVCALRHRLGHEPSDGDVSRQLGISRRDLERTRLAQRGYHAQSLDAPVRGTGPTLGDSLPHAEDPYLVVDAALTLRRAISRLSSRDRHLLRLRYGHDLTQADIGVRLGMSQMHVSRLLRRILDRLHASLVVEA